MLHDPGVLELLVADAPIGLGVLDADLRWIEVNDAMATLQSRTRADLVGRRPSDIHAEIGPEVEAALREARTTGATVRRQVRTAPGEPHRWFDVAVFPVGTGVGMAAVEITDRVDAERRLAEAHRRDALMARAGELLSTALSVVQTAELVAQLAVPEIADWCAVELQRDGRADRVATSRRDPGIVPDPAREVRLPLIARGRSLGDLVLGGDAVAADVARALADRAALALDNAALYAQRDRVAVSLQEQLLPPRLPPIPGLDVAARYSAAGEGNEVGGDFYDVFACGAGWQVVIGDVVGKGPAAAAVTGLARHTLRAAAAYEGAPSQLLRVLNDALLAERPGRRLASVACVRVDPQPDGALLTTSAAGHPLPLAVAVDGTVRELGRFGQLLGVERDVVVFNTEARLAPGELVVLYTDGVIEARGPDGTFGEEQLRALLATLGGEAPSRVLQRVEAAVLAASGGRPRDDVAMVAIRVRSLP